MERKEWKSLYLINKSTYFIGFKPVQWVGICSLLFIIGWFAWWVAMLILIPVYMTGKRIARMQSAGHPDPVSSEIIWFSMKKYFIDEHGFFDRLEE